MRSYTLCNFHPVITQPTGVITEIYAQPIPKEHPPAFYASGCLSLHKAHFVEGPLSGMKRLNVALFQDLKGQMSYLQFCKCN